MSEAPVAMSEAPVAMSEAPVAMSEAPVAMSEAPVVMSEAPVVISVALVVIAVALAVIAGALVVIAGVLFKAGETELGGSLSWKRGNIVGRGTGAFLFQKVGVSQTTQKRAGRQSVQTAQSANDGVVHGPNFSSRDNHSCLRLGEVQFFELRQPAGVLLT